MWYTGYDGSREGVRRLGLATSHDGIAWQRYAKNPLLSDLWVEDIMIVPDDEGTLWMFAEGRNDQAQLLSSRDGVDWKRLGTLDVRMTDGKPIAAGPYGTPAISPLARRSRAPSTVPARAATTRRAAAARPVASPRTRPERLHER